MTENSDKPPTVRRPPKPERSQRPLWAIIAGLVIALYSFRIQDQNIGTIMMGFGFLCAFFGLAYWLINPKHGLK